MNEDLLPHYFDYLFVVALSERERWLAARNAGIDTAELPRIRGPWAYRSTWFEFQRWFQDEPAAIWLSLHRQQVAPFALQLMLQRVNIANDVIHQLIWEGDLRPTAANRLPAVQIRFTLPRAFPRWTPLRWENDREWQEVPSESGIMLTDLASASAMMTEMLVALSGAIYMPVAEPFVPPRVRVAGGSISFTVAGGILASGVGLIVACCEGMVPGTIPGFVGGAALASAGLIELALDWTKKLAEIEKIHEERRVSRLEHDYIDAGQKRQIQELEIRKKEIELQVLRLQAQGNSGNAATASAGLFPPEQIAQAAEDWGVTIEFAEHLLNQGVPTYLAVRRYCETIQVERRDPEIQPRARAASGSM